MPRHLTNQPDKRFGLRVTRHRDLSVFNTHIENSLPFQSVYGYTKSAGPFPNWLDHFRRRICFLLSTLHYSHFWSVINGPTLHLTKFSHYVYTLWLMPRKCLHTEGNLKFAPFKRVNPSRVVSQLRFTLPIEWLSWKRCAKHCLTAKCVTIQAPHFRFLAQDKMIEASFEVGLHFL